MWKPGCPLPGIKRDSCHLHLHGGESRVSGQESVIHRGELQRRLNSPLQKVLCQGQHPIWEGARLWGLGWQHRSMPLEILNSQILWCLWTRRSTALLARDILSSGLQSNYFNTIDFLWNAACEKSRIHILLKWTWALAHIDSTLLHNPNLGNLKRTEIIDSVFSDLNRNSSEENNREMPGKVHKYLGSKQHTVR